jgi:outer membrane beta-barrel protein
MNKTSLACLAALALLGSASAIAQQTARPDANQVVVPEVERRDLKLPKFPSNDFAVGAFAGIYNTENFGAHAVGGLRLGYHITEDWFVESILAQSKVSDDAFQRVLPGSIFADSEKKLRYYNVSAGYNVLPGEVFLGSKRAKATAIYLIAGIGSTKFGGRSNQTINFGFGGRLMLIERAALQVDVRDHVFSTDLLGKRESTHNLEMTAGFSYYF